jgi:pimeloyl-ACP methyl ester carboxylesterase
VVTVIPDRFVTVDGRTVHLIDVGSGPSVVFETGAGGFAAAWLPVLRLLPDVRGVAVDRPGMGWSDPGPEVLPVDVAARLLRVLDAADVSPPYLLVGHSLGALHVRAFAARYPDETAGLVLVDPSHERMSTVLDGGQPLWRRGAAAARSGGLLTAARLPALPRQRLLGPLLAPERLSTLLTDDAALRTVMRERACHPAAIRAGIRERAHVTQACVQMASMTEQMDLSVAVLSAAAFDASGRRADLRAAITDLHRDLANQWDDGRHITWPGTTHMLPIEDPAAVASAVRQMLSE